MGGASCSFSVLQTKTPQPSEIKSSEIKQEAYVLRSRVMVFTVTPSYTYTYMHSIKNLLIMEVTNVHQPSCKYE